MEGRLRRESLSVQIETTCAHCGQRIAIELDEALRYRVLTPGAQPLVASPIVDFSRLADPNIIDAF